MKFSVVALFVVYALMAVKSQQAIRLTALGCYRDKGNRALPVLLEYYRNNPDWLDMNSMVRQCSKAAQTKGYQCFAVQFFGECWSGPNACSSYTKYGESTNCFCGEPNFRRYRPHTHCPAAVGGAWANFVYKKN